LLTGHFQGDISVCQNAAELSVVLDDKTADIALLQQLTGFRNTFFPKKSLRAVSDRNFAAA